MSPAQYVALELALVKGDGVAVEGWKTSNVNLRTLQGRFRHYVLTTMLKRALAKARGPAN